MFHADIGIHQVQGQYSMSRSRHQAEHGTPEHMHTNTFERPLNARHAAEASVTRALAPTAAAGVLCTGSVRSPAALAPSRRPERTPLRAAARAAIAAAAAFGPRVAAAAGELLAKVAPIVDVPPVASLVRRTDRPMKDGPTAQWPPAGLGTEVTFPPDTSNKAECGLWVPKRQVAVVGLGGRHQLDSSCT